MSVRRLQAGSAAWNGWSDHQRRFVLLASAVGVGGVVLGFEAQELHPLTPAAGSLAVLVGLRWAGEACGVPARLATSAALAAAAVVAVSLIGAWGGMLWVGVLALVAAALQSDTVTPDAATPDAATAARTTEEPVDEVASDDAAFSQTRRHFEDVEVIEGVATVAGGPNHVVFHPPMGGTPEVELHPLDDLRATLQEVTPHGFRVTVKGAGRIAYAASASSSHSSQGSTISSLAG